MKGLEFELCRAEAAANADNPAESFLQLYRLAGRNESERIAHRFADDPIRLGADQDQIALGDGCRLRAPDIDTDGRQHGAAVPEFRHAVGRVADDADGDASADAAHTVRQA